MFADSMRACGRLLSGLIVSGLGATALAQPPVEYVQPQPASIAQELELTGSVTTALDAALSPRVSGLVSAVLVDAGDRVASGQPLLQLDATLAALQRDSAAAALREARTRLAEARRLRDEAKPLAEQGNLPASTYASRQAEAKLAAATVARLQAQHAEHIERVDRHELAAPFAGVIRRRLTAPGEWVNTGQPVLELVGEQARRIDVQVPQQRYAEFQQTRDATVTIDALPGQSFAGRVADRVAALDTGARSFLVRVALPEDATMIVPGMSARVRFQLPGAEDAVAIPRDALLRFPDGSNIVWLIDAQDQVRRQPVSLGPQRGEQVVITKGLQRSDKVVVRGNESLRPGQAVSARRHQP